MHNYASVCCGTCSTYNERTSTCMQANAKHMGQRVQRWISDSAARTTIPPFDWAVSIHSKYLYNHLSQVYNARAIFLSSNFHCMSNAFLRLLRYTCYIDSRISVYVCIATRTLRIFAHALFIPSSSIKIYVEICIGCRCPERTLRTHAICIKMYFFQQHCSSIFRIFCVYLIFTSMDLNSIYSVLITYNWFGISRMAKKSNIHEIFVRTGKVEERKKQLRMAEMRK